MADDAEEIARQFSISSNDALHIRLGKPGSSSKSKDEVFHPAFTYPIFGDDEVIFGYKGLKIELDFAPVAMTPSLKVSWTEKFPEVKDVTATDIEGILRPYLPTLEQSQSPDTASSRPPGSCIHSYTTDGRHFEIWSSSLSDPRTLEIVRSMQILILFYIEGGSYIDLNDPPWTIARWRVFLVYEAIKADDVSNVAYSFVGYSTTYRLFFLDTQDLGRYNLQHDSSSGAALDSIDTLTLPARERISQFLILPPFQSGGHGSQLYKTIVSDLLSLSVVREITVEDPNETFDDMRDINDLIRLRRNKTFAALSINPDITVKKSAPVPLGAILPNQILDKLRRETKTASRQFARVVEMHTLSKIPILHRSLARITRRDRTSNENDRAYFFWRLLVKERLYRHNREVLIQLDVEDRLVKLEETIVGVERDYVRLLAKADQRTAQALDSGLEEAGEEQTGQLASSGSNGGMRARAKRKILDDDDDDDDDDENSNNAVNKDGLGGKRPKMASS